MASWVWILIVIAAVVIIAVIAMAARQRRTAALRQRFGLEYDRAVQERQGRRPAEAELRDREKQRAQLDIRPLPEELRARFAEEWRNVQERFVDQPAEAVVAADRLVHSVMEKRGYPMGDFEAQADLRDREKQRAQLDIRPLPEELRARFAEEWREVQERFVDQPAEAVVAADRLVHSVMEKRGYPMGDFEAQADLVSVDHPAVVENYRAAHGIHERAQQQQASTEDLREALLRYRSLFDELLQPEDGQAAVTAGRGPGNTADQAGAERSGPDPDANGQGAGGSPETSAEKTEVTHD